jgi:UDP-galactopyranose mutase
MIGPTVKIDPDLLPHYDNVHYLGMRPYSDLPAYFSGWDVALLPFAKNEATRFISPTKTPEYLAAGKPVVSTSIQDIVRPYGELGLVAIADEPSAFAGAIAQALDRAADSAFTSDWLQQVDQFLSHTSWDQTWSRMMSRLDDAASVRQKLGTKRAG